MKYYAYVLQSLKSKRRYYGHTQDLDKRLLEHNAGKTKSTKAHVPYKLVFYEVCSSREEAINRERFFKSGSGREYIQSRLKRTRSSTG